MESNELILKLDKETTIPLIEGLGKSAYAIAVAHGFRGTEQEWLDSLKGLQGPQGDPGPKGDPFRYEDFTPEQLAALKGPKGDKGEDGRDGTSATADNAHQLLLQGNVWCESASVDDVLTALIGNMGKPFPRTEFKPLTIPSVIQGQQVVSVTGEPHYSVKVVGNDTPFSLDSTGACNITIPPLGEDDIKLTYHNFTGAKVGDYTIAGVQSGAAADEEYEENGIVYKRYGDVLKMNITNNTVNGNFKDNPKNWDVTQKVIYANKPSTLNLGANWNAYGPYFVETPENITFKGFNNNMRLTIATSTQGTTTIAFDKNTIEWDATNHSYINTGGYNDGL
nr:MAG TPA: nucleoid-associated protein [Caudoviricetes sp.]